MADGLSRGQQWAAHVREEYSLNPAQDITVDIAAETMDVLDCLPATALAEARQQRFILLRAFSQLALPDEDGDPVIPLSASQRGRKAANARWHGTGGA